MNVKGTLKAVTLELRRELDGRYDAQGTWHPGDLERRLAFLGVWRDRPPKPVDELPRLAVEDGEGRRVVDAFIDSRREAGQSRDAAISEFVRDAAYTWANRLLALRCMEARGLIDEVILQKDAYAGRSLQHNRLAKKQPERCAGEDEGLFAALFDQFARGAEELPLLFNPRAPEVALRPSVAALKRCISLLSGTSAVRGQEAATDEVFTAPDALGWTYQYWNTEEKDRVFEKVRTKKGSKIEGAEIVPATCIYTEPYMVKFLVQNSLGAIWMGMNPESRLADEWDYFVPGADRAPVSKKPVAEIMFLDPACGSGHFLIEAFELFYTMYVEEGVLTKPAEICASILERNLYGIDIDERSVQIAALALFMKAKEKSEDFVPRWVNLVATNIRLPSGRDHLETFLQKHPEDAPLKPALLAIFEGLAHADELGSLLQIEEPVEKELRALKAKYEAAGSPMEQQDLWRQFQKPVQGKLPIGVATYEQWKQDVLARLRAHFDAEAHEVDLGAAFFGEAATKGLSLVDMLARRYDVVAANPPYMGSKNMGLVLKKYVERHFAPGKRDLYAAFILRCLELAAHDGRFAMVTQQSWMFQGSYVSLRAGPLTAQTQTRSSSGFGGVLRITTVEVLAHLGRYAFSEVGNAAVAPVLFVIRRSPPSPTHLLRACRLAAPRESHEQAALLRECARNPSPIVFRPAQNRFLQIPESPLSYWLRERLLALLAGRTVGQVAEICQGLATANEPRFVRYCWETIAADWSRPRDERRWVTFENGGGYGKWFGKHFWTVDWGYSGARIRATPNPRVQNEAHYFSSGWCYSYMASGSLGLRRLPEQGAIFSNLSSGVFPRLSDSDAALGATLNSRCASAIVRSISAKIQLSEGYVSRLPLPVQVPESVPLLESDCIKLKSWLVSRDACEQTYAESLFRATSLRECFGQFSGDRDAVCTVLLALEAEVERRVAAAFDIGGADLYAVLEETGRPAGWLPLVAGFDAIPELTPGLSLSGNALSTLSTEEESRVLSAVALADLKRRIRAVCDTDQNVGAGGEDEAVTDEGDDEDEQGEAEVVGSGARIPVPAETFLEELAQKLEIHPTSVYWLLRELRETEGIVSRPELVRFVEDYLSVLVLRLLGHQWPREIEAHEPTPAWSDKEGIIPLMEGTSEQALISRLRARLAENFGDDRVGAVEREFQEVTGKSLAVWLSSNFFKRHISQFRKRPIAWQLASEPVTSSRRGRGAQPAPAFACLIYYHRLDADLVPKLRTHYVGPLRTSLQTELGSLDRMNQRSTDQDTRRVELERKVEELAAFDARLEQVLTIGFASPTLDTVAAKEPIDKWCSRDGRARASEAVEAFLVQERRYDPDLNDGVRVNIAPLQRAGLLAADVLAAKDLEKAIADRAEWRADERRWCREGKLPQPGWWSTALPENHVAAERTA